MRTAYVIHMRVGYTDGKPSWGKSYTGRFSTAEDAKKRMAELCEKHPERAYRVRKETRR